VAKVLNIPDISLKKIKVLYLGGFNDYKGIEYLVNAIQSNALDDVVFLIPVFGSLVSKYMPALNRKKNVFLLPHMEYDDMIQLYTLSDIVIVPSLSNDKEGNERSPNAVIEALACGKVVIGTDVGGIPAHIGEVGLLIPEKDSRAIIKVIIRLASDKELMRDLKTKARKRAEDIFDIRKYADDLLKLSNFR